MRKLCLMSIILVSFSLGAETPCFFTNITNLWFQGHKSNVLAIAEERLRANNDDAVGLLLRLEYDIEFLNVERLSNSVLRVKSVFAPIETQNLSFWKPVFMETLDYLLDVQTTTNFYARLDVDRAKAALPEKHMLFDDEVRALCLDGLVTNYPPNPQ